MTNESTPPPFSPTKRQPKGVLNVRRVRFSAFLVVVLGLFATSLLCILAIWDYADEDTAWRAVSTLGVIAGTMVAFTILNEALGSKLDL